LLRELVDLWSYFSNACEAILAPHSGGDCPPPSIGFATCSDNSSSLVFLQYIIASFYHD
jgi:hypothetical protein